MCLESFVIVANKFNVVRICTLVRSSPVNSGGGVDISGDSDSDDSEEEKEEYILQKGKRRRMRRRRMRRRRRRICCC